ncbi:CPBP family intramembrane glutamic endopeptidase [Paracoccus sp. MBLB3053]|uniref:CPBP family intramembrane glutamic endopeptidase n=1 Tax=Paracoccus aurantius TaxID=3073814 RepID=A0ABU2HZU7_9RHOB|nr:CPBP family intramembrane glutamic endopeptidase [Paracoccus sp. MBLB3053]MDS9470075.1 CPBP family intramembrane glutamic endopeptidase [Paracoccus sp. MBLB3053]
MTLLSRPYPIRHRLAIAIATLALWTAITLFGAGLGNGHIRLEQLATSGIAWQVLLASLLLVCVMSWAGWRDLGFRAPASATLRVLWLPGLFILLLFLWAVFLGLPAPGVMMMVLANTLLVGFSEEVMFRGVLFRAINLRLRIWPAIIWTSASFGLVHVLNGFLTGSFGTAFIQAIAAACTGLLLVAILLRTGSLWVAIVFHALWDWVCFLVVLGAQSIANDHTAGGATAAGPARLLVPFLIVLPNLLWGLWLLRGIGKGSAADRFSTSDAAASGV